MDTQPVQPISGVVKIQQFYYTYCLPGRSVSGSARWQIRALSSGVSEGQAIDMSSRVCSLDFGRLQGGPASRQDQLVLVRDAEHAILARSGYVGTVLDREATFTHALVLDRDFDALQAIASWGGAWVVRDGAFSTALPQLSRDEIPGGGELNDQAACQYLSEASLEVVGRRKRWAAQLISNCISVSEGKHRRIYIYAEPWEVARLIFIALRCLPDKVRREMTISTHEEDLDSTLEAKIVGCSLKEGRKRDLSLPGLAYGAHLAINTYFQHPEVPEGPNYSFAEGAASWIQENNWDALDGVLTRINGLDRINDPAVPRVSAEDVDTLYRLNKASGGGTTDITSKFQLSLASRAICADFLTGPGVVHEFGRLYGENAPLYSRAVEWVGSWLPGHRQTVDGCRSAFVDCTIQYLRSNFDAEGIKSVEGLFCTLSGSHPKEFQASLISALLDLTAGPSSAVIPLAWPVRLGLFRIWDSTPGCMDLISYKTLAGLWLRPNTEELKPVLCKTESESLQELVVQSYLGATHSLSSISADVFTVVADNRFESVVRSFFLHPKWLKLLDPKYSKPAGLVSKEFLEKAASMLSLHDSIDGEVVRVLDAWLKFLTPTVAQGRIRSVAGIAEALQYPDRFPPVHKSVFKREEQQRFVAVAAKCFMDRCSEFKALRWFLCEVAPMVATSETEFLRECPAASRSGGRNSKIDTAIQVLCRVLQADGDKQCLEIRELLQRRDGEELETIAFICLKFFPAYSLVYSPGSNILAVLSKELPLAGDLVEKVRNLNHIRLACEAETLEQSNVFTLSKAYADMAADDDKPLRDLINEKLRE